VQYYFAIFIFLSRLVFYPMGGYYNFLVANDMPTNHVSKLD